MTQIRNDDLVNILRPDFQARYEPQFHLKSVCSLFQALPALRGFWPMSSVAYTNPQGVDLSVQGNDLTNNNTSLFGFDQLAPYVEFDGINQYLSKLDSGAANWADVTGLESYVESTQRGLTFGGWFYFDTLPAAQDYFISKWSVAAGQYSYRLRKTAANNTSFGVSVDGTAITNVTSSATLSALQWIFLAGRFTPSTELSLFENNSKTTNVVAIPASIFDSTSQFNICGFGGGSALFDGKTSMCFLCASALSDALIGTLYHQSRALYGV